MSDKYNSLLELVGRGPASYGERLAGCAAMDSFFLCRGKEEVKAMFPVNEAVSLLGTWDCRLQHCTQQGCHVRLVVGPRTPASVFPSSLLSPACQQ